MYSILFILFIFVSFPCKNIADWLGGVNIFHVFNRGRKILKQITTVCHASGGNVVGESSSDWKSTE